MVGNPGPHVGCRCRTRTGVDAVNTGLFEQQWRDNLYKLWLCRVGDYAERAALGDRSACWRPWAALIGSA
jgi:hypothetical protein